MMQSRQGRNVKRHLKSAQSANDYILWAYKNTEYSPRLLQIANETTAYCIRMIEIALSRHREAPSRSAAIRETWSAERHAQRAVKVARKFGYQEGSPER